MDTLRSAACFEIFDRAAQGWDVSFGANASTEPFCGARFPAVPLEEDPYPEHLSHQKRPRNFQTLGREDVILWQNTKR